MWEIWNEPWISYYWPIQPFQKSYLLLLRVAHDAIRNADPGAKVVLGGMPNASWDVLRSIYRVPGAKGLFDVVDIHAYTRNPAGVVTILKRDRAVMRKAGDGSKPIILGEMGWTSSLHQTRHQFDWETTPAQQASNVRSVLALLAANRERVGLAAFYWYTWINDQHRGASPWGFAGLLGYHSGRIWQKPALKAFHDEAFALEHRR
jgi:arabinogalactan endo-1,4-beta-galactosidase